MRISKVSKHLFMCLDACVTASNLWYVCEREQVMDPVIIWIAMELCSLNKVTIFCLPIDALRSMGEFLRTLQHDQL